ncbi:hypothetical protein [Hydrogenibacillus schlegelii]|uniref:hypothetical protein n=1 Tax=Hydrogenibacillus schlegelii TaxID=1484 RepID=UPI0023541503|nr:hypothetical protein [Hydrogenibacillus schlegelii]
MTAPSAGRLELDDRPLLAAMVDDLVSGRPAAEIALTFHRSVAGTIAEAAPNFSGGKRPRRSSSPAAFFGTPAPWGAEDGARGPRGSALGAAGRAAERWRLSLGQAALAVTGGGAGRHEEP